MARRLRILLRKDKTSHLSTVIAETGPGAAASTILHALKPFIGSTNPKKQKWASLPMVFDEAGRVCSTPEEAQNR